MGHTVEFAGPAFDLLLERFLDGVAPLPEWGIVPGVTGQRWIRVGPPGEAPEVRAATYEEAARKILDVLVADTLEGHV